MFQLPVLFIQGRVTDTRVCGNINGGLTPSIIHFGTGDHPALYTVLLRQVCIAGTELLVLCPVNQPAYIPFFCECLYRYIGRIDLLYACIQVTEVRSGDS